MLYTSFFSAIENEILHSSLTCCPSLWPIATRWHPDFIISSTTSGEGHAWHLITQEDDRRPKFTEETVSMFYLCVTDSSIFTWPMRFKILTRAAFLYFLLEMHGRRSLIFTKTCPQNCSNMDASCKGSQSNVNPGALTELSDSRMWGELVF